MLEGLIAASLPAIAGVIVFAFVGNKNAALLLLTLGAFTLRLYAITLDPFLQDWDERFHALVAKNMTTRPFTPMMRTDPIMPYDPASWCCNHIWVHKQPLFLWQMALSLKIFGTNEFALRLPSAIMGALNVPLVYSIAKNWTKQDLAALFAAVLAAFSFYQIELSTGRFSVDHNDVAFTFFMTLGIYALTKHLNKYFSLKWAVISGIAVGCAILIKWLIALLIFGGWGLFLLLDIRQGAQLRKWSKFGIGVIIATCIALPWQVYINMRFPIESAASYEHNKLHITEVLGGHDGGIFFHFQQFELHYHLVLLPFLIIGLIGLFLDKSINWKFTVSALAMIAVIFAFFSIFVATKMIAFTFAVSALVYAIIGFGMFLATKEILQRSIGKFNLNFRGG